MRMLPAAVRTRTAQRKRWLRGWVDWQTSQEQQTIGTPVDVPVPRKVNVRDPGIDSGPGDHSAGAAPHPRIVPGPASSGRASSGRAPRARRLARGFIAIALRARVVE